MSSIENIYFEKVLQDYMKYIEPQLESVKTIKTDPEKFLRSAFIPKDKHPHYSPVITFLEEAGYTYHSINSLFAQELDKYFKKIEPKLEVRIAVPNTYPSPMEISYSNYPIIRFNVFKHQHSDYRNQFKTDHKQTDIDIRYEYIKEREEEIETLQRLLNNPWSVLYAEDLSKRKWWEKVIINCKSVYLILTKRNTINENLNKRIAKQHSMIEMYHKEIEGIKANVAQIEENRKMYESVLAGLYDTLSELFDQLGYEDVGRRKLY